MTGPVRAWAEVLENREAALDTRWLLLDAPDVARSSQPGQFVMIGFGLEDVGAPFLPRPFSVGWCSPDGRIGLLVRSFGRGTRRLSGLEAGERALVLGPLGRGFALEDGGPILCVAGGVGLAPFLFVGARAWTAGIPVTIVYGERSADRVFSPALIRELTGVTPEIWTEDGSKGRQGLVLDDLDLGSDPVVLGCGPTPMLRALVRLARNRGVRLQVSVEEHMGCGIGTCQGCVVPSADGRWIRSCIDGPVFDARELLWRI